MKRILCLILTAVLFCSLLSVGAYADGKLNLTLSNETAHAGEQVEVLLSVENNPGLKGLSAEVTYDESVLTLVSCTPKISVGSWMVDTIAQDHLVYWYSTDVFSGTEVVSLQFQVAENAPDGKVEIGLAFSDWDGVYDDKGDDILDYDITVGSVTVVTEPTIEDGYYLIGQKGWTVDDIDLEQKFEANPSNSSEFMLTTDLAVGDGIKVVQVSNGAIVGWYPDGMDNQYIVDVSHSGEKTIYFKPYYDDAWSYFGGYIYIEAEGAVELYGASVSLKGNIGLNFYLIPTAELLADEGAYVTLDDAQYPIKGAKTRVVDGKTLYQFSVDKHAKEMNDKVVLKVFSGSGAEQPIYRAKENKTSREYQFSIQDYIQKTIAAGCADDLAALLQAMSDYGSLAQVHFNYPGERAEVKANLDSVTADMLARYASEKTDGTAAGMSYYGSSLVLESETVLRIYFTLDSGAIGDYTFKLNGKKVTPVQSGDLWYVQVTNIAAKDLDKVHTLVVSSGEGTVFTAKSCALSYAYSVLNAEGQPESLVNVVKGLYLYNEAANAYFG